MIIIKTKTILIFLFLNRDLFECGGGLNGLEWVVVVVVCIGCCGGDGGLKGNGGGEQRKEGEMERFFIFISCFLFFSLLITNYN